MTFQELDLLPYSFTTIFKRYWQRLELNPKLLECYANTSSHWTANKIFQ